MSHRPVKAKYLVVYFQKILQSISTLLVVNISVCTVFFFLSLYQEYALNLYNFLLSFILYGALISLSLEIISLVLFIISKKRLMSFLIFHFFRIFFLSFLIFLMFTISLWLAPHAR